MKTLIISLIAIMPLLSSAQDTTIMGGFIHIRKSSKNVDKVANMAIMPNVNTIETKTIPDSLRKFNIIIGSYAYQLTDTSKWVVLDTAATLATLLEFVIQMQWAENRRNGIESMPYLEHKPMPLQFIESETVRFDTCYMCGLSISEPDPVIVRLTEKLNAAYNILRLINVNGYVRKKNMPEFIKARDAYIKLNQKP